MEHWLFISFFLIFIDTGKYCLSGGDDRLILLWNPYNGKLVNKYRGHNYEVLGIDVTQDSSKMASCGGDKQPLLWDVTTGTVLRRFRGHDNVNIIYLSPFALYTLILFLY